MKICTYPEAIAYETRRRIIDESIPRIKQCLSLLTDDQVWHRANENSNSVGNLILHLCGNARQWIIHALDNQEDIRTRNTEFNERGPIDKSILICKMDQLAADIDSALNRIVQSDLLEMKTIQKHFNDNGISILIHAIEHFSYHTGQITFYTKMIANVDTSYYGHLNL